MEIAKKICKITGIIILLLIVVFLAGRYGWKAFGFQACQSAGIERVAVDEDSVAFTGFYPGSFPEGFCGCFTQEQDGKLYVGFRFSAVFGFFETGDFEITIPVKGEISEEILKTSAREDIIWSRETSNTSQAVLPGTEKPSALELKNILDEINLDIQPGAAKLRIMPGRY